MGFFRDLLYNGLENLTKIGDDIASDPTGARELQYKSCIRCSNCTIKNVDLSDSPYEVAHVFFCNASGSEKYGVLKLEGTCDIITDPVILQNTTSCENFSPACEIGEYSPLQQQWDGIDAYSEWSNRPFESLSETDRQKILNLQY